MNLSKLTPRSLRRSVSVFALSLLSALLVSGCGSGPITSLAAKPAGEVTLTGKMMGGQQPIVGAKIQLYAAGTVADQSAATPLIAAPAVTGSAGEFSITGLYTCPSITAEVYLIGKGGNPGLAPGTDNQASVLMSALGPCGNLTSATHLIVNEVSTIGSIYPITPFMASYLNVGSSPANFNTLASDFMLINQFINTDSGQSPGPTLPGGFSAPIATLYTLANSMASCVNSVGGVAGDGSSCGNFLQAATPPAATPPTNTADAILAIATHPTNNVVPIFNLAPGAPAFQPTLTAAPVDWSLRILPNITITTPSTLVGVGSTNTGTITLGQAAPAGGLTVSIVSDQPGFVSVVSPVTIATGVSTGTFTYTGQAPGNANLTASAPNYVSSSVSLAATNSLISLGTIPVVAPGQSVDLPLSLGTPAPAGGVTINFASTAPGVATITPNSVNIAAGLKVPASNPKVNGITVGTAQINANATGFAPGAQNVTVSVTASLPANLTVPLTTPTNITLTISAPAPAGGITFALSSDSAAIMTVPANVTVPQGSTTVNIPITGNGSGTTTLRADSPNIVEATSSITVNGTITLQNATVTTGKQIQVSTYFYFNATPPSPVAATITSVNPAVAVVSINPGVQGGATATVSNIVNTNASSYYVQGVGIGSTTLSISAPGYTTTTVNVTVDPSGFVIYNPGSIATTTLSANSNVSIFPAILNPGTFTVLGYGAVTPAANVNVALASSDLTVGTLVTSPLTFTANDSAETIQFHPVGPGTANITLTTPAGFSTPTPAATQQIVATVTAPPIAVQSATVTGGKGLEVSTYAYLTQTPLVPTTLNVSSSNPAVAVVSASATAAGAASVNLTSIVNTNAVSYYIQGLSTGTTTLTLSAPPYSNATVTVTVDPAGFVIYNPGSISTTSLSSATSLSIFPAILNPGTLTVLGYAAVAPQFSGTGVPVTSSSNAVGTITSSPVVFQSGDSSATTTFQPAGAGTSTLSLGTPLNFSTPTPVATQQITATVTAPPIGLQNSNITGGKNLEVASYFYLSQTPLTPITAMIVSDTPSVATVSSSPTLAGAASASYPNTVNTNALSFYVQGQAVGTAILTITAPGYTTTTVNVTVDPSGFVIYNPGSFSTTTFSSPTSISVFPAILSPSTFGVLGYASLNPGISTINVAVNSSATQVGTVTSPVVFSGGSSSGTSTFTPVAAGSSTLSIVTPAGFSTPTPTATQQITATVTAPPIGLQNTSQTTGTNLEISTYAYLSQTPPSPVTMTVTSSDTSIATISTSATVAGGGTLTFPSLSNTNALSFYVQGHAQGTVTLTMSAAGFSNAVMNVTVYPSGFTIYNPGNFSTTTFSSPTSITIFPTILTPGTLNVVGYGALNPGIGTVSVPFASATPAVGTVTTPINFTAGSSSATSNFQPVAAGTSALSISTPAGFSTPSSAATQSITATVTAPPIGVQNTSITTGLNLQLSTYAYLGVTPPAPVTLTVTSSNPAAVLLSTSATVAGVGSLSFPGTSNTNALSYYVEGVGLGSSVLTITAPGFSNATVTVSVTPSGFIIYNPGNFSTTTFSAPTSITVFPAVLNSGVLTVLGYAALNPGVNVAVPISSGTPAVGTVSATINFTGGSSSGTASFQPAAAGTSLLSLGTPVGFTTPSQSVTQQITATVTAPPIGTQNSSIVTGASLEASTFAYLGVTPPAPVTVTVTSADTTVAKVSTSPTTVGGATISFPGVSNSNALSYYVQGVAVGSTTITLSAPGFANTVINVTVDPSGFIIYTPGNFTTSVGANNTGVTIYPAILNPGVLTVYGYGALSPSAGTVGVPVGSTSPQIGTVSPTTVNFTGGISTLNTSFHPVASGQTNVIIVSQPAGFTTPSQPVTQQIVVTVQ